MPARRRIDPIVGRGAVIAWAQNPQDAPRSIIATAVRYSLEELGMQSPGRTVEVRVPPFGAVQCVEGPVHTRGTPPNVVEMSADAWLRLVTGMEQWGDVMARGMIRASGQRADVSGYLPLVPVGES